MQVAMCSRKVVNQATYEKVMKNLNERYNMNGLIAQEKLLYLPYSQRTVSMAFFDASEVVALLLSCPSTLNQDENYLFNDARTHLLLLWEHHHILVILTLVAVTERHTKLW